MLSSPKFVKAASSAAVAVLFAAVSGATALAGSSSGGTIATVNLSLSASPVIVSQSSFTVNDYGNELWLVCSNWSQRTIDHFEVSGTWVDPMFGVSGQFHRLVRLELGPEERAIATVDGIAAGPHGATLQIAVTRVRFTDLALWTPNSVERVAMAPLQGQPALTQPKPAEEVDEAWPQVAARSLPDMWSPSQVFVTRVPRQALLAQGTPVDMRLGVSVDSATARNGDVVPLIAAQNVVVDGMTIIAAGSVGFGHLDQVGRAANWGRCGSLTVAVDDVEAVDGSMIALNGGQTVHPPSRLGVLGGLFGGLFRHGQEAAVPEGVAIAALSTKTSDVAVVDISSAR
ncbi:MAG: hypothetical protein M3T49_10415 [Candidatus Eremiobacteraeota bacterium]|nr:hypothetical protein [Candidatus Eremiobacteraeota bacterium]